MLNNKIKLKAMGRSNCIALKCVPLTEILARSKRLVAAEAQGL